MFSSGPLNCAAPLFVFQVCVCYLDYFCACMYVCVRTPPASLRLVTYNIDPQAWFPWRKWHHCGGKCAQFNTVAVLFHYNDVNHQLRLSNTVPSSHPPKDTETTRLIKMMHMESICSPKQTVMAEPLHQTSYRPVPGHDQDIASAFRCFRSATGAVCFKDSGERRTNERVLIAPSFINYLTWSHQCCHCWRDQKLHQMNQI